MDCPQGYACDPLHRYCHLPTAPWDAQVTDRSTVDAGAREGPVAEAAVLDAAAPDAGPLDRPAALDRLATDDRAAPDSAQADRDLDDQAGATADASLDAGTVADAAVDAGVDAGLAQDASADASPAADAGADDGGVDDAALSGIFADDFDSSNLDRYLPSSASWVVSGSHLHQTEACGNTHLALAGERWADAQADVDFSVQELCASGYRQVELLVRYQSYSSSCANNHMYACAADIDGRLLHIAEFNGECVSHSYSSKSTPQLATGLWYHLSARVVGELLTCTLSGDDLGAPVEISHSYSTSALGSIGLFCSSVATQFDNFSATPL